MCKSSMVFSKSVTNKSRILQIIGFPEASLPSKYLGVPIIGRKLRVAECDELIGRLLLEPVSYFPETK